MSYDDSRPRVQLEKSGAEPFYEGFARGQHTILGDERDKSPPVGSGEDKHPTPVDYLLWSLAACQAAVLSQCLSKARVEDFTITVEADIKRAGSETVPEEMPSHTQKRVEEIDIDLTLKVPEEVESRASRCLEVYDQGCIVGQSLLAGIEYEPSVTFVSE